MGRSRMMILGVGLAMLTGARHADAQSVFVDVGVGTPGFGARVVWGSPAHVAYRHPVLVYEPAPVYYYPAPVGIVYYGALPVAYWDYLRMNDPYRYARFRTWLDYERSYQRAWRAHDRARYDALRAREDAYFRERSLADRGFREWTSDRHEDRRYGRGRERERGRR